MPDALIGHTGFVGSNLASQRQFDAAFNSSNIRDIRGRAFDEIICAGAPGTKWRANLEPAADWTAISILMDRLETVAVKHFTLISTVDVYGETVGLTENDTPRPTSPYGLHRRVLEQFVESHFRSYTIIRLPALFGPGMKKNALFDLMIHHPARAGLYQWYPVRRLATDAVTVRDFPTVNFTSPPISMSAIRDAFLPQGTLTPGSANYDLASIYGHRLTEAEVWQELCDFLSPT